MTTPQGALQLIREDASFRDFSDTLVEGLEGDARDAVSKVLDQQRIQLLAESANVGPSVFTHGWTVLSFRATRSTVKIYKAVA